MSIATEEELRFEDARSSVTGDPSDGSDGAPRPRQNERPLRASAMGIAPTGQRFVVLRTMLARPARGARRLSLSPLVSRASVALLAAALTLGPACREAPPSGSAPAAPSGGCGKRVLIVTDEVPGGEATLAIAFASAGFDVATTQATSSDFRGVPSLAEGGGLDGGFDAVVVLSGGLRTPPSDMPVEGQQAIAAFVARGGGLVLSEWAAFQLAAAPEPRWKLLAPLVLLDRSGSRSGRVTYEVEPSFASHPLWAGLPPSFSFSSSSNVGTIKAAPGIARVAQGSDVGDTVAIRDLPSSGRIVHLAHAGNHVAHGWANVNVQRLMTNAVGWVARCEVGAAAERGDGGKR